MEKILSQKFYDEMKKLEPRYPTRVALLLPALHAAQEETSWLYNEVIEEVAEYIGIRPSQVKEVASFYTMFHLKPVGKYHFKVCTNVACSLRGAEEIVQYCEKKLNVCCGQTTPDQRFTLNEEECIGACGTAPAMMLNDEYYENLTKEKIDQIVSQIQSKEGN